MTLFKHPKSGIWFIDIRHQGHRIKRSTGTRDKSQAQEWHDHFKARLWRESRLGETPPMLWDEVCVAYLKTVQHQRDYEGKARHIRHWTEHFRNKPIDQITTEAIEAAVPRTKKTPAGKVEPMTGAAQNRYLSALSAVLRFAHKRGWLDVMPLIQKRAEASVRELFATREQAEALLDALGDGWMRDVTEFAFFTGMRASEILGLKWSHVVINQAVVNLPGSMAKSGSGRVVPLNDRALDVIKRRKDKHKVYVFARHDTKAGQVDNRQFKAAVKAAGLPDDFRFHDCRHSWASWMAQAGVPLLTLQRLGGWKTLSMLNRYAHFAVDDLARYVNVIR